MMISSCAASCFIQFSHSILVASDFIFQKRGNIFSAIYNQRLQCTSRMFRHSLAKVRSRKGFQQVVRNNHMTNIFWAGIGRDNCGGCWTVNIVSTLPDSWEGRWKALRIYSQSKYILNSGREMSDSREGRWKARAHRKSRAELSMRAALHPQTRRCFK